MVDAVRLSGRYNLRERIATGGMGAVYAADDERLGRRVAVKVLKRDLAGDPRFVERFRREARAVASLSHPNMVSVYDYGEEDDHSYIVMELVDGRDLAQVLRDDGPLDPERVRAIGAQVCAALGHAHAAGIVHRDVKPGNVILTGDDRAKVADFGIARAVGDATLTATGSVMGTAHYLSPEQAAGKSVTPASDVYSLGIVLWELLTGRVPFEGDTPIAVAMRHVSDAVPRASAVRPGVPPDLDDVVATATAKDPADRFASAEDMAAALEGRAARTAVLAGATPTAVAPAVAEPPATGELAEDAWPRGGGARDPAVLGRRVLLVLAALVAIAVVALAARLLSGDDGADTSRATTPVEQDAAPEQDGAGDDNASVQLSESIIGRRYEDVEAELKAEGYAVGREDVEDDAPAETVVGSEPPPGSTLQEGQEITLVVSKGPPEEPPADEGNEGEGNEGEGNEGEGNEGEGNEGEPPGKGKGLEKKLEEKLDEDEDE